MVGVAFLTLLECRILGYIHIFKGPKRVGFVGIFQPFREAMTLFSRDQYFLMVSNNTGQHTKCIGNQNS
jgi:NADH-ubiquinone oxidoreductase chain 1